MYQNHSVLITILQHILHPHHRRTYPHVSHSTQYLNSFICDKPCCFLCNKQQLKIMASSSNTAADFSNLHVRCPSCSQSVYQCGLPKDWKRRPGCPRHTWLQTLNTDLHPLNYGLNSAWQLAQDRERCWRQLVEMVTLQPCLLYTSPSPRD